MDNLTQLMVVQDAHAHHFIKGVDHHDVMIGAGAVLALAIIGYFVFRHLKR